MRSKTDQEAAYLHSMETIIIRIKR